MPFFGTKAMFLFFEPTITVAIISGVAAVVGGVGGTIAGYFLFRPKHKAEVTGMEIDNDVSEGEARRKLLAENEELSKELQEARSARDVAKNDARTNKNLLEAKRSEVEYLREQAKAYWMAEGGCLERERLNSEKLANMERDHAAEIAEVKRDFEQQIEDIKSQLREALQFKEKNAELAEENTRILAENEELRKRDGAT